MVRQQEPLDRFAACGRVRFPDADDPYAQRRLPVVPPPHMRRYQSYGRRTEAELGLAIRGDRLRRTLTFRLATLFEHFQVEAYGRRAGGLRRQHPRVGVQGTTLGSVVDVPRKQHSIVTGTHHKRATAADRVLQELKRIRATVADVDHFGVVGQAVRSLDPQPAFARFAGPFGGHAFVLRDVLTYMQDLVGQPQHGSLLRLHNQTVVGDIPAAVPVTDLAQILERLVGTEIQLRPIMHDE